MKNYFVAEKSLSHRFSLPAAGFLMLLFTYLFSLTAHAAQTGAVTVAPANSGVGVVSCTRNGTPFTNYTYAASTDYITVSALPFNKEYQFLHWTDNGVIVSDRSTYSFSVGTKNHLVIAHFTQKAEFKGHRYDSDKNISSLTRNTPTCDYASGYKIDGMALNTTLITIDDTTKSAVEALTGGKFLSAFRINFTFGYEGKPRETLDHKVHLVLQLQEKQAGNCYVTAVGDHAPVVLNDLDEMQKTVTFETAKSGIYVVTTAPVGAVPVAPITPAVVAPAVPAAIPATVPASVPAAPITEAQYQEAIINILRYQLQQAGLTPVA